MELKAAAERILAGRESAEVLIVEARRLAARWLRENDDDEPITDEWLLSVGFKHDEERPYHWINGTFTKFDLMRWDNGDWELADSDNSIHLVPCINSRGAARRLCSALGIALREDKE
jgi:hypothetical protein